MNRTVFGFGINDAGYPVRPRKKGSKSRSASEWCPYYRKWAHMIQRCYDKNFKQSKTVYKDVTVCDEWAFFSAFREWAAPRYRSGFFLDKDILGDGKVYSPDNCAFVDLKTNNFILDRGAKKKGKNKIGFYLNRNGMYQVNCSNPFLGRDEYVGVYDTEEEAHQKWMDRKNLHAVRLAAEQTDCRVSEKLISMYR